VARVKHNISISNNTYCENCGKSLDLLLNELVNSDPKFKTELEVIENEIKNFNEEGIFAPQLLINLRADLVKLLRLIVLVVNNHNYCITEEEFMIKNLIE